MANSKDMELSQDWADGILHSIRLLRKAHKDAGSDLSDADFVNHVMRILLQCSAELVLRAGGQQNAEHNKKYFLEAANLVFDATATAIAAQKAPRH